MSHANVPLVVGVVFDDGSFLLDIAHARFLFACTIVAPCMEGDLVARFYVILDILSSFQKKEWRLVYNQSLVYIVLI